MADDLYGLHKIRNISGVTSLLQKVYLCSKIDIIYLKFKIMIPS